MAALLPLLMAYSLIGETFHELAGTAILLCFLTHHWLNRGWWKGIFRGRHTARRIFRTALDLLLLPAMLALPLTGMLMSKQLYTFLPTEGLASAARAIHLPLANWCLVLMSLHAGTHLGSMLPKKGRRAWFAALGVISVYGVYAFAKRRIPSYMFLKLTFAFFDYSEPRVFFFADYLAVMILFAMLGYGIESALRKNKN